MKKLIDHLSEEKFQELIKKYIPENLVDGEGKSKYYFIPPELVIKEIDSRWVKIFKEPEEEWDNWVNCQVLDKYLQESCDIDSQIYYDILIAHYFYYEDRPTCPSCGDPVPFLKVSRGYHRNCSESCKSFDTADRELTGWGNPRNRAIAHMKKFKNAGNPWDICDLYIATLESGSLKFGITSTLTGRLSRSKAFDEDPYVDIKSLYRSTRIDIAELEFRLKEYFNYEEYIDKQYEEVFPELVKREIPNSRRKRILLLNVHPDDEVLAFGGLIHKEIGRGNIIYSHHFCVGGKCSSAPTETRIKELMDVYEYLHVHNFSYDTEMDGCLSELNTCELTGRIDKLIEEFKPHEVYVTPDSEHADHHALYKAFVAAARLKSGWMPKLFAMGTYPFSNQLYNTPDGGKIFQPLSQEDFEAKCNAFALHKSQFKPSPSPLGIDGITVQSKYNGMMCGCEYAELYYQLRYIRCLD